MSRIDRVSLGEAAAMGVALEPKDHFGWRCHTLLKKFHGDSTHERDQYDEISIVGNMLMYGGASNLWECLKGNGTGTAAQTLTHFNNTNAAIGVGDSSTAEAATQNDLVAATNKLRVAMDSTYPTHTDGTANGSDDIVFRSTFTSGQANFVWAEWAIFNSATAATGRMLNRKVEALGTKASGTWQLTLTLSLGSN